MNDIETPLKKLKSSKDFKQYSKKAKDNYLASCFKMGDSKIADSPWQFDFYSESSGKMSSFQVSNIIKMQKDQEVFGNGKAPERLDLSSVKLCFNEIMDILEKHCKKNMPNEQVNKKIVILQQLNGKAVWNVTLLTASFNVINIRLDASNGSIINETCESIFSFKLK